MKVGIIDDPSTASIIAPAVAIVDEPITIHVDANDDQDVDSIYVYFAGFWHSHNCSGVGNCSFIWTTREPYLGQYTYKAKVKDSVGQWSSVVTSTVVVQSNALVLSVSVDVC